MTEESKPAPAPSAETAKPEPERSLQDQAAIDRLRERRKGKRAPRFEVSYDGNAVTIKGVEADSIYEHAQLADLFATADTAFSNGVLEQIANIARTGKQLTSRELNFVLATVRALDPRDATEALLTVQMAAIHNATIVAARRLTHCDTIAQQDSNSNMLNKLARTFAAQIEALKRYRSSGEQNVRVTHQHVNVTAGQAVVGINPGGGGTHENPSQSHALGARPATSGPADARGPALLSQEQALGMPLQGAGREGPESVPHARRTSRSADGQGQRRMAARAGDG